MTLTKIENKNWWKEAVIYQIYPRSFKDSNGDGIGDIEGIIEKLDYLQELGISAVWLCPVNKSPNDDNGYDISDYYDIMDEFGIMTDFENLINEMHKRDIKLIMDLVVNHSSDEHFWFKESKKSKDNYYRDFYYWRDSKMGREPNDWQSFFSGSAWEYDNTTEQYYLHLFSKKQPDLNWENPKVREEIQKIVKFWLDKGVDGFRLDAINFIAKDKDMPSIGDGIGYKCGMQHFANLPKVHEYLFELNQKVIKNYDVMTVGETSAITVEEGIKYSSEKSKELSMVFHFDHMGLEYIEDVKWKTRAINPKEFKEVMSKWQNGFAEEGWNSIYLGNHDQSRIVSRFGNDKEYRLESAKMLATILMTQKGTPYIYQGDEIAMTNFCSKNIVDYDDVGTKGMYKEMKVAGMAEDEIMDFVAKTSRDNARTPMQWNGYKNSGFTAGTPWLKVNENHKLINVDKSLQDKKSVLNYYKKLIRVRKEHPVFVYGNYGDIESADEIYAYTRELYDEKLLVVINLTNNSCKFNFPISINATEMNILVSNYEEHDIRSDVMDLKEYEACIFILN